MQFGINLPHVGRKAGADAITRAARQAEQLGYDNIWVNDHLAVPVDAPYPPSALFYEPVITLTWAAAATARIGLGTSVLVLPMRHPVHLAKELATLDLLSGGRLVVGAGVGWLAAEFASLGVPFDQRGARTDETIKMLRACWSEDPVTYRASVVASTMTEMRTLPQPGRMIPIWIGGKTEAALRRAVALGDGWHGVALAPDELAPVLAHLRAGRPEAAFTTSLRLTWDGLDDDSGELRRRLDAYAELGLDHMSFEPRQRRLEAWLDAVAALWDVLAAYR